MTNAFGTNLSERSESDRTRRRDASRTKHISRIRVLALAPLFLIGAALAQDPAAEAVLVTGLVTAESAAGTRTLGRGDELHVGDTVRTADNSYANLLFRDGGRILLRPNTEFAVEAFEYRAPPAAGGAAPSAAPGKAFFKLVRGGFRAITGLVGRANKADYKLTTPVATLGIRGTDYDALICEGDCPLEGIRGSGSAAAAHVQLAAADTGSRIDVAQAPGAGDLPNNGFIVAVNNGAVTVTTPRGTFNVDVGQVLLALQNGQTFVLPVPPDPLLINPTPDPEACD